MLLLVGLATGCARGRNWMIIEEPDENTSFCTADGVTIAAEAWTDGADMRAAFKKNLLSKDILPIRITIWNRGDSTISFSSTQAKLRLNADTTLSALPFSEVTKRIQVNEMFAAAVIIALTAGYGQGVAELVSHATAEGNWNAQEHLNTTTLDLARIDHGEALTGFVFYDYKAWRRLKIRSNRDIRLEIKRIPRGDNPPLSFSLACPLSRKELKE